MHFCFSDGTPFHPPASCDSMPALPSEFPYQPPAWAPHTNHHQEVQPRIASLSIADLDRHGKKSKKKQYLFSWWPPISSMLQLHNGLWHTQTGSQSDILLLNSANTWSNSESAVDNILFGAGCPLTFVFSLRPTCWETLLPTGSFFDANHSSASEASSSSPSCCSRHDQT